MRALRGRGSPAALAERNNASQLRPNRARALCRRERERKAKERAFFFISSQARSRDVFLSRPRRLLLLLLFSFHFSTKSIVVKPRLPLRLSTASAGQSKGTDERRREMLVASLSTPHSRLSSQSRTGLCRPEKKKKGRNERQRFLSLSPSKTPETSAKAPPCSRRRPGTRISASSSSSIRGGATIISSCCLLTHSIFSPSKKTDKRRKTSEP